jgi:hypothetical protein
MLRRLIISRAPSVSTSISCTRVLSTVQNQKLRNDIKSLGITLGEAIKADDEDVFNAVEKLRLLGREVSGVGQGVISADK